jgi:DNA repair protein RecO (recombination protein O)
MLHTTHAIVLRTLAYGETSLIVHVFTEKFGMQSCLIQGVRKSGKTSNKASAFSIGAILQLTIYYQANKQLHRIKEAHIQTIHTSTSQSVVKNAIVVMLCELVHHTVQEPETHEELFYFLASILQYINDSEPKQLTWMPQYFCVHFAELMGFGIHGISTRETPLFYLKDGVFLAANATHSSLCTLAQSLAISKLQQSTLENLHLLELDNSIKKECLQQLILFYQLHIPHMQKIKSIAVLEAVFE